MIVDALRTILFERWICGSEGLTEEDFKLMDTADKMANFRASVDELLRYHQFYGGISIVLPLLYGGWFHRAWRWERLWLLMLSLVGFWRWNLSSYSGRGRGARRDLYRL